MCVGGMLVYAGQTAWRVFLGGRGWVLSSHKPLMEGHRFKIQEATKSTQVAAGGSLTLIGLLGHQQVFNSHSSPRNEDSTCTGCTSGR